MSAGTTQDRPGRMQLGTPVTPQLLRRAFHRNLLMFTPIGCPDTQTNEPLANAYTPSRLELVLRERNLLNLQIREASSLHRSGVNGLCSRGYMLGQLTRIVCPPATLGNAPVSFRVDDVDRPVYRQESVCKYSRADRHARGTRP